MPFKPPKPCSHPGCGALTHARFCKAHARVVEQQRGSAASRGYGWRWQKARAEYLNANPLCVHCLKTDRVEAATIVDHIEPHKGDQELFWRRSNWQSLCKPHHDAKTATEDGGFGRAGSAARG